MELFIAIGLIIIGFAILIFSADILVKGAVSLAYRHQIPASIVALTIVAFGTSAPELVTSVAAALKGVPDASAGNVIGSNLFNLLGVVGFSCLLAPTTASHNTMKIEWPILIIGTILFCVLGKDYQFDRWEGLSMIVTFGFAMMLFIRLARKTKKVTEDEDSHIPEQWKEWLFIIGGIVALAVGAQIALEGAVTIGKVLGMSDRLIGLTILSVGTGLPELATSAVAAAKKQDDISIGNVIGSNIMNTLFVTGTAATIVPLSVQKSVIQYDSIWMLAATTLFWVVLFFTKNRIPRWLAFGIILTYATYLGTIL